MVTIKKIAERCGVSTATVSKALNNESDIGVETAARVRQAAREMGYMPNAAARALKTKHSRNLGILTELRGINSLAHEFISKIISGIQSQAEKSGYDITLLSNDISGMAMSYLEHCRYRNFDGVAIFVSTPQKPEVLELIASEIPCVSIDHLFEGRSAVFSDNARGMRDLVDYVYAMGHRKIAFIHGENTVVTRIRVSSFIESCCAHGIEVPAAYIKPCFFHDAEGSTVATRELLSLPNPPSCIFYPDDFSYVGGMNELEARGLSVPRDISVVGFDGIFLSQLIRPRLTTLRQNAEEMGAQTVRLLCEAIESPVTYAPRQVLIPGKLLRGDSVGTPS